MIYLFYSRRKKEHFEKWLETSYRPVKPEMPPEETKQEPATPPPHEEPPQNPPEDKPHLPAVIDESKEKPKQ
jgi:hypothetical protein